MEHFKQPSYENYHNRLYTNKNFTRTLKTDPQMKLVFRHLDLSNKDSVLEVGCGIGDYTNELSTITKKICAVDLNTEQAKKRIPGVHFQTHNANEPLPFESNEFDVVVSINLIEHLKNPTHFLNEIKRVLKKNGRLAIATANLDFFLHDYFFDKTHLHEWTLSQFKNLIEKLFIIKYAKKGSGMFKYYPANYILTHFLKPDLVIIAKNST